MPDRNRVIHLQKGKTGRESGNRKVNLVSIVHILSMKAVFLFVFSCIATGLFAQTIKGKVTDSLHHPLPSATVQLNRDSGNIQLAQTITDSLGNYSFTIADSGRFTITASFVGFGTGSISITVTKDSVQTFINVPEFSLVKASGTLAGVTVTASTPAVSQKADTIQYSANQYKVNPDATSEDLVKKMPGITVGSDGTVTAHGDQVKKVLVDGKEYFGDDATAALRNLPAEVIDKIQVFDKLSDQAQFTGFDDGNSQRTINIVTKGGLRNSQFGKIYAGYGTDNRYTAGGNINFFNGDRRIGLIGLSNNINQQNFAQQDLLGVLSSGSNNRSGGQRGGGGRGGPPGGGGAGNFLAGTSNGINTTHSFGINYSDIWGKKVTVTGSYFFNNSRNTTAQLTNQKTVVTDDTSYFTTENLNSTNNNYNNRVNLRMEYKIDSANQLIFTPVAGFQNNHARSISTTSVATQSGESLSNLLNQTSTNSSGYNFSASLLYRHAFHKKGRSLSFGITPGMSDNTGETYQDIINDTINNGVDSLLFRDRNSHTKSIAGNVSYTEPVGKKALLQFNYNPSYQNSTAKQLLNHYDDASDKYSRLDTSQSNVFNNDIIKHNAGASYRIGDRFNNVMVGVSYQFTAMKSDQDYPENLTIHKTFNNALPNLMLNKKLGDKSNLRIFYRAATQTPSVTQLQNVYNTNNPLSVSTGNPDLKQSYNNTVSARYTYTNTKNSTSFFLNAFVLQNNNYITNATTVRLTDTVLTPTFTLSKGGQLTRPVNLDGYASYRTLATYSFPLKAIKTNLSINGGFNYVRQPGLINENKNKSDNYQYSSGLVLASNISEYVDFTVSYTPTYNVVKNTLQPSQNQNYYSGAASVSLNLLSKKGWVFHSDVINQTYSGLSTGFNQPYTLWNASAGKKFLKGERGDLRLSVFDILKQNRSIVRTIDGFNTADVRTNVLQRYGMLTFTYKINNVRTGKAVKAAPGVPQRERNRREEPPSGPPPGGEAPGAPPPGM